MKISYNWLKEYIEINQSPDEIGEILTQTGLEVELIEQVEKIPGGLSGIVVGEVKECEQHPNADKLKVTKVDVGQDELLDIVCGAPNVAKGQKVLVATVNTTIYPTKGEPFKIKKAKIRGEVSQGMICAEDEIGLGSNHDGIMVLDTKEANGTLAVKLFETGQDHIYEIGLTPNRGDATSHMGTARDLKAYFRKELTLPSADPFETKEKDPIKVTVKNVDACPRYSGITIRDVTVATSPDWLQWKLRSIGLEPINNVVDITNYVLHSLGQPMHAFDADKIKTGEVVIKTLPAKTKFTTLDEKERELHEDDLMICDGEKNGICIAGVFGGLQSGVKEHTKNIFLEVAYFSEESVRATALRHGLSTDASFRYERGTDPEMTIPALKLATSLILELAGGYVASEIVDIYPEKIEEKQIDISFRTFDRLIGKSLEANKITEILNWLDIKTTNPSSEGFTAIVPAYRSDVTRPADLVEEVLRIYGFNEIALDEEFSTEYLAEFAEHEPYRIQEDLSKFLAGKGFSEILTNSLTNPSYYKKNQLGGEPISMLNPSSEELAYMKTSPVYTALESIAYNINRKNGNLKFFEFGRSYQLDDQDYQEKEWLTMYLTGQLSESHWIDETRNASFHDLSNITRSMLNYAGIRKYTINEVDPTELFDYALEMKIGEKSLGVLGSVKNEILEMYGIKQEVYYSQLDWEWLIRNYRKDISYEPIPKYPEVKRDLSLVLDRSISFSEVEKLAFRQEAKLLRRMNLFSVYEGEKIEKGKKAYAISFYLQDKFKTLTDKQIEKSMNALMSLFEKELGAVIRK